MPSFLKTYWSSVGKKVFMALTGLAMVLFLIEHLSANLLLFSSNPDPYNEYSHFLLSLGSIIIIAEFVLIGILLLHVVAAIFVTLNNWFARPKGYAVVKSAGPPSKKNIASTTMIYTGLIIFAFIIWHLITFKYGPWYTSEVNGKEVRDLYRLVVEVFQNPIYVVGYVAVMILIGFHLYHGFWSAFQSLGMNHPKYMPFIYGLGVIIAIVVAVGFLAVPIWMYFFGHPTP